MYREVPRRWALRLLHPKLVVLVVAKVKDKVNAMAASWCMPVSANPPLMVVSISPHRYTYKLMKASGKFTINVMPLDKLKEVHLCGTLSGAEVDKIKAANLHTLESLKIETPGLEEAIAILECKLFKSVEAGDHVLFIGQILAARVREDIFPKGTYSIDRVKLLYHLGGDKYTTTADYILKL